MLPENELLQYVYKTADMGVAGIEAVLEFTTNDELKKVLRDQMSEYVCCRAQAEQLLAARSDSSSGVNPIAKMSAQAMATGKLLIGVQDRRNDHPGQQHGREQNAPPPARLSEQ